jgi:hypothetical protein
VEGLRKEAEKGPTIDEKNNWENVKVNGQVLKFSFLAESFNRNKRLQALY